MGVATEGVLHHRGGQSPRRWRWWWARMSERALLAIGVGVLFVVLLLTASWDRVVMQRTQSSSVDRAAPILMMAPTTTERPARLTPGGRGIVVVGTSPPPVLLPRRRVAVNPFPEEEDERNDAAVGGGRASKDDAGGSGRVSPDSDTTSKMTALEACRLTNPESGNLSSAKHDHVVCVRRQPGAFHLVITLTEEDVALHGHELRLPGRNNQTGTSAVVDAGAQPDDAKLSDAHRRNVYGQFNEEGLGWMLEALRWGTGSGGAGLTMSLYVKSNLTRSYRRTRNLAETGMQASKFVFHQQLPIAERCARERQYWSSAPLRQRQSMWQPPRVFAADASPSANAEHGASLRPCATNRSSLNAMASTSECFRSSLRDIVATWTSDLASRVEIIEIPNVGDEATGVLSFLADAQLERWFDGPAATTDSAPNPEEAPKSGASRRRLRSQRRAVIFVHSHRSSWHSLDIIEQLGCLCVDTQRERYRTLTYPSVAFVFQCVSGMQSNPLVEQHVKPWRRAWKRPPPPRRPQSRSNDDVDDAGGSRGAADEPVLRVNRSGASLAATRPRGEGAAGGGRPMFRTAPPLSGKALDQHRHYIARLRKESVKASARFGLAFDYLFGEYLGPTIPEAFIRDCCASFVVTREGLAALPSGLPLSLLRKTVAQPYLSDFYTCYNGEGSTRAPSSSSPSSRHDEPSTSVMPNRSDNRSRGNNSSNRSTINDESLIVPLDGDLSMYFEHFWRLLFNATAYDQQRDYSLLRCKWGSFDCGEEGAPYSFHATTDTLMQPFQSRPCPKAWRRNYYP